MLTVAGKHKLRVALADTDPRVAEVAGSPLVVDVLPAAPAASNSTHNIEAGDTKDSTLAPLLDLIVTPQDRFGNGILSARGFNVSINDGAPQRLLPPEYRVTYPIPLFSSSNLRLNFTLDGEEIANSPVTVSIMPLNAIYGGILVVAVLALMAVIARSTYTRISSQGFDTSAEKAVSVDKKLRQILDNKIRLQNMYMSIEVITPASLPHSFRLPNPTPFAGYRCPQRLPQRRPTPVAPAWAC
jgi:hypothetical protein